MFLLQENCPDKLNASSFIYFWESYLRDEKKKNPSHENVHSRSMGILFAVHDFNFHSIIFAKLKCCKHFF